MTTHLRCDTQKKTFSEIRAGFNGKFTAPFELVLLDLLGIHLVSGTHTQTHTHKRLKVAVKVSVSYERRCDV